MRGHFPRLLHTFAVLACMALVCGGASSRKQSPASRQASAPSKQSPAPQSPAPARPKSPTPAQKPAPPRRSPEIRALWIARWDYHTPDDVKTIVRNALALGCNCIYFQVRGEGTSYYPSKVEPWAWELTGDEPSCTGRDPGWDPLRTALDEAHLHNLQVHAYMNVLPVWKQATAPPKASGHIYATHPEWIMVDRSGKPMSPARQGFYAFLNPALPQVRTHLARVFAEVAERYPDLDGIHLDYIRYPGEMGDYSYDKESLRQFKQSTAGAPPEQVPLLWNRWRASRINLLLGEISREVRRVNPSLEISAAVIADYKTAIETKMQRWRNWPELGLVDAVAPMAYHYDLPVFSAMLDNFLGPQRPRKGKIVVGVWPSEKWQSGNGYTQATLGKQIALAREKGADGIALFGYSVFFPNHKASAWAAYVRKNWFTNTYSLRRAKPR